jgi:hypothetical protein
MGLMPRHVMDRDRDSSLCCGSSSSASSWDTIPPIDALQQGSTAQAGSRSRHSPEGHSRSW